MKNPSGFLILLPYLSLHQNKIDYIKKNGTLFIVLDQDYVRMKKKISLFVLLQD